MVTPSDQRPRSNLFLGLNARAAKRILAIAFEDAALPFAEDDAREIVENATGLDRTGHDVTRHRTIRAGRLRPHPSPYDPPPCGGACRSYFGVAGILWTAVQNFKGCAVSARGY